ncbi:hypothetical protein HPB47_015807 [Ixodes persulcatus]|uniref:Uncharacterized protein n=1 Tax=Ixodes persulcatus TaxID=34615 RepID=A0AC60QW45_IXOPE|nr:hypothetical protein HPB47_015807 [Ixodes persulcatus]
MTLKKAVIEGVPDELPLFRRSGPPRFRAGRMPRCIRCDGPSGFELGKCESSAGTHAQFVPKGLSYCTGNLADLIQAVTRAPLAANGSVSAGSLCQLLLWLCFVVDHHAPLSDQLGRADNLCNIVNTLRKYEADAPELWSFLPLCFVLPEQTQQLRDVADALGYSLTSSGWQLKPVRSASKRQPKSQHISRATIADVGLLQKV